MPLEQRQLRTLGLGLSFRPTPKSLDVHHVRTATDWFRRSFVFKRYFEAFTSSSGYKPNTRVKPVLPTIDAKVLDTVLKADPQIAPFLDAVRDQLCSAANISPLRNRLTRNNLPAADRQFLRSLRLNRKIVVKATDKNLGIAVLDTDWYCGQCDKHLLDTRTYSAISEMAATRLRDFAFTRIEAAVNHALANHAIDIRDKRFLLHRNPKANGEADHLVSFPLFYALPKVHKTPVASRPIVASHSFVTTAASVWVDSILQPHVRRIDTVLSDSLSLVRSLHAAPLPAVPSGHQRWMLTADVESLYPSIPIDDGIRAVGDLLGIQREPRPGLHRLVVDLLTVVLQFNVFACDSDRRRALSTNPTGPLPALKFYKQNRGTAMGTPTAVSFANVFMAAFFDKPVRAHPFYGPRIVKYFRYIDDVLMFIDLPFDHDPQTLCRHLNTVHANLRLNSTVSTSSADFLDVAVRAGEEWPLRVDTAVHQKALNRYLYTPAASFHPPPAKRALISGELRRYARLSSTAVAFYKTRALFFARLRDRGYTDRFLRPLFTQHTYQQLAQTDVLANTAIAAPAAPRAPTRHSTAHRNTTPLVFALEYTSYSVAVPIRRIIRDSAAAYGIQLAPNEPVIAHRRTPNLRHLLVSAQVAVPSVYSDSSGPGGHSLTLTRQISATVPQCRHPTNSLTAPPPAPSTSIFS